MRLLSVLLLLAACNPSGEDTGDTGITVDPAAFDAIRSAVLNDLRRSAATGAQVAIWYHGQVIFSEGFGTADPDADVPVTPTTLFQFGSDEKKLTAIGLLQQVRAGRVSLDETLSDALPDLHFALDPTWSDQITVRDLISHQTALFDYTPWTSDPDDAQLAGRAYGRFADHEYAMGPPGVFWNYANPNFSLAGLVAEEASGTAWPDLMEHNVFRLLGMDRTFARLSEVRDDGEYAVGTGISFTNGMDEFEPFDPNPSYTVGRIDMADQVDNAFTRPAGLVWSTAEDMTRVAAFLMDGDPIVLPDDLRRQITTAQIGLYPGVDPSVLGYGFGIMVGQGWNWAGNYYDMPVWHHGGNTLAMTSTFYILPTERLAVCVLSNGYGDSFLRTVGTTFSQIPDLPAPVDPPTLLPPPSDLASYAGTWEDPYGVGTVTLSWDGAALTVSMPDLEDAGNTVSPTVTAVYRDIFTVNIDGGTLDLRLYDGPNGEPHQYMVDRLFVATRSTERAAHPPPLHPLRPADFTRPRTGPELGLVGPPGTFGLPD